MLSAYTVPGSVPLGREVVQVSSVLPEVSILLGL